MSNSKREPKKNRAEVILIALLLALAQGMYAQDNISVQVKTFNQQLEPYRNIEVSINGKDFINMGNRGVAFTELTSADLPIKTIIVRNTQLEAASWNYSKGTLEIIVRTKNYQVVPVVVKDGNGAALPDLKVTFRGRKTITANTDRAGRLELLLALDEKAPAGNQFSVDGFTINNFVASAQENVLTLERMARPTQNPTAPVTTAPQPADVFQNFDLTNLDSIQSLTVWHAVFKNFDRKQLSEEELKRIDDKFNELVSQLENSARQQPRQAFVGRITDSTFVAEDIKNLLSQVQLESEILTDQREEFDEKIRIINSKLVGGAANLDETTRNGIISDLALLERLLIENESRFYKNQNDYRALINAIKERLFDIQVLEQKLSESELQRLEEQRVFRQRLLMISAIVLLLGMLIIVMIYFGGVLRKQKKQLIAANTEVKRINENLEGLVFERTRLLENLNSELDTFLYRASHDMRTPVRSILGLCHITTMTVQGEATQFVSRIADTATSMDKLLKKLSAISEINHPTDLSQISIATSIDSVRESLKEEIRASGADIATKYADDLSIESYPNLVNTIINNLIENAIFYSSLNGATPKILVEATYQGDDLCLRVQDNGIGIDESVRARVFEMFFKGTEHSKGHGLGLYIVQKAVQALNGTIAVESIPGIRTTFTIILPITLHKLKQTG